jgi:hypothetical protein
MIKRTHLFLMILAGSAVTAAAQSGNWVLDQFDNDTTPSYVDQHWGSAKPSLVWNTNNSATTLGPNNPGSGSSKWVIPWTTTGDQIMVTHAFAGASNLNQYTTVNFDIRFDSASATDGHGSFGALEIDWVPQADGWASTPNPPQAYTAFPTSNTNWVHVSMPLNAGGNPKLSAVTGIGFKLQQNKTGSDLTGTTTFYLDNIILSGLGAPQIVQLTPAQLWQRLEFQLPNIPAAANPFDPAQIRLDATFTLPSSRTVTVPAFWYQGYQRLLSGGNEQDTLTGSAGWRLRFTPPETGGYSLSLTIQTNGAPYGTIVTNFTVAATSAPARFGYVGISTNQQYFQTSDGQALPLIGEDVCWPSGRGTYDYDSWFSSMQSAGENFARLWMSPMSFGIETVPTSLNNYSLAPAWQLDYVLQLAEQKGIYLQFALDFHGMFVTQPDYWGGGNYWPQNPYNLTNGGPCVNPNAFFTNATAKAVYQKRLRYLAGRYGYSQNLLGWEFFNEIDNDYAFLNANDVAAWHALMGNWLHTNDPFGHLITTSLTYASAHAELWSLPQLDYVSEHAYTMANSPLTIASDSQTFLKTYGKPIMVGEFGTSWQGWNRSADPYLRGFREGLWSGALGGSVGTSMAWWWQNIDSENDYSIYAALAKILHRTSWGAGSWTNITFRTGSQILSGLGQRGSRESLLYLVAADAVFPTGGTNVSLPPQQGQSVALSNWSPGTYYAEWYDPATGTQVGASQGTTVSGILTLPLPDYTVDLVGKVYPPPTLSVPLVNPAGYFQFQLNSETWGQYAIQKSTDLVNWTSMFAVTNVQGAIVVTNPEPIDGVSEFFRASKSF